MKSSSQQRRRTDKTQTHSKGEISEAKEEHVESTMEKHVEPTVEKHPLQWPVLFIGVGLGLIGSVVMLFLLHFVLHVF